MTGTEQPNSVLLVDLKELDPLALEAGHQVDSFLKAMGNGQGYFVAQRLDAQGNASSTLQIPFRNVNHTNQIPGRRGEWTLIDIVVPTGSLFN